ncbi:Putative E3 ubiquitin ligase complex SCF subunit scon-2 [Fusarium oxysporum f. sp. cubense race 1]|uniref:Putative E3 ubiquitin ligase complex SCF subunit scon-2 n=1 Tax=Fusarium oxysporum f. sp. cubense (strain race 1) TaxID=1229664 RepID=N4UIU1_FUSC1|nr:Putative E3 ubiquitin ligase complex SCF subunit scon-2 [Fusarium oxysporum f. sp. cubense race 1]
MESPSLVNGHRPSSDTSVAAPGASALLHSSIPTSSSTSQPASATITNHTHRHASAPSTELDSSSPLPPTNGHSLKVSDIDSEHLDDNSSQQPSKNNCDRHRSDQEINPRLVKMPSELVGKTVSPFLKEHIPGLYAPFGKAKTAMPLSPSPNNTTAIRKRDPNSKFCYRHRPDSKCRRAADETKMGFIQTELNSLSSADQEAITHVWSLFSAAPSKHRELMLQGIITQCCFPQLSTVSREVQEQLKIDFLAALPTELSYKILSYLDTVSLCKAAQVSRRWRNLADDDVVWHRMCEQHIDRKCTKCGWGLPLLEKKKLMAWSRHQQVHRQPNAADVVEIDDEAETQSSDSRKRQADDEHQHDDRVAKRSRVSNGENGSFDKTIKIWNWQTGECLNTLQCHTEGVLSVHYDGCTLASGSIDKTVKVFSFDTKQTFCLRGHTDWVNHVRIDSPSRVVFSASDDLSVKLWDIDSKQCIKTFLGHVGQVQQVLLMPADFEPDEVPQLDTTDTASVSSGRSNSPPAATAEQPVDARAAYGSGFTSDPDRPLPPRYMLTGGLDNTVRLWDTTTGKCIRSMFGHVEGIWGLVGDTLRVVTGANDSMTKIWEPRSGKCERSFTGHAGPVTCVGLSDSRMASGSEDGEVRLYSFEGERVEERGTPS